MTQRTLIIAFAVVLTACEAQGLAGRQAVQPAPTTRYHKDQYACELRAYSMPRIPFAPASGDPFQAPHEFAQNLAREREFEDLVRSCMRARGWNQ